MKRFFVRVDSQGMAQACYSDSKHTLDYIESRGGIEVTQEEFYSLRDKKSKIENGKVVVIES